MAEDSISYWTHRLEAADTPAEIEKCHEYLTHYRNHEEFLAGLAARRRRPTAALEPAVRPPLSLWDIACLPLYLAWLLFTGVYMIIVWVVFATILLVLANMQWEHLVQKWSFLWN